MNKENLLLYGELSDSLGLDYVGVIGLNVDLINDIANKKYPRDTELIANQCMLRILKEELISFANGGNKRINDSELEVLIKSIRKILLRNKLNDLKLPFKTFDEFYENWRILGLTGGGSYAIRRNYVTDLLNTAITETDDLLDSIEFSNLATPANEITVLDDWNKIISEVEELKVRYNLSRTPQDFSTIGVSCVRIIESISRIVYKHDIHGDLSQPEPSVDKTDIRIGQIIMKDLGGRENAELRGLASSTSKVAHRIKHATTPNQLQAGIACDAVILLTSIINRLEKNRLLSNS